MLVTLLGIVMEVRLLHPQKTLEPIFVTLLGIMMEGRLAQPMKADCPILVTLLGIVIEVRSLQSSNILNIDNQLVMC